LLKEINKTTDFTSALKHYSNKNNKMNPTEETFLTGIIGKGCNIGIHKLANISTGITLKFIADQILLKSQMT